jgi:hypothetical protein
VKRLLLASALSVFAFSAHATTWWVDPVHGNDSNDGLSVASAFLTLQHAESGHAIAGDTVYGLGGTYLGSSTTTDVLDVFTSGLSGRPITWQCYPGPPKQACIIAAQAQTHVVHIAGNYVTFENWELAGPAGTITLAGALTNASSTTWNTSGLYNGVGLLVDNNGGGNTTHHVTVQNNRIHDFANACIDIGSADYINVIGNVAYNCAMWSPYASSAITTYGNKALDANGYINITGNTAFNAVNFMPNNVNYNQNSSFIGLPLTPTSQTTCTTGCTQITISTTNAPAGATGPTVVPVSQKMVIYDVTAPTGFGKYTQITSVTAGTPGTVQFNNNSAVTTITSGDTLLIGFLTDGECYNMDNENTYNYHNPINVINNLAFGCGGAGFQDYANWNTKFLFNTAFWDLTYPSSINYFYSNGEIFINSDLASGPGSTVIGNIVVPSSNARASWGTYVPGGSPGSLWACNLQYGGSNTLPGSGNVSGNPLFVNPWNGVFVGTGGGESDLTVNFQILPGSPAEDVACGSQYVTFPITDILGNPRPAGSGTDMGAFEE